MKKLFLCIALLFLFCSSCQTTRFYSEPGDNYYLLADYQTALHHWSAQDEIHHDLIGVADVVAVYKSWEVRQAFLYTYKTKANPLPELLEKASLQELNGFHNGHEFILGMYCYKKDWIKLTGQDPIWHLTLENDMNQIVEPLRIEKIELKPEEDWRYLDYLSHWRETYRVIFPLTDADLCPVITRKTRYIKLNCDSILGGMELKWSFKPVPENLM